MNKELEMLYPELFNNYGDTLSVKDIADYFDISENTVYTYLKRRKIKGRKVGKNWIVTRARLIEFIEK